MPNSFESIHRKITIVDFELREKKEKKEKTANIRLTTKSRKKELLTTHFKLQ